MGKKKNGLKENQVMLYGSVNGWLKIIDYDGDETVLKPEHHYAVDAPQTFFIIGVYNTEEEEKNA